MDSLFKMNGYARNGRHLSSRAAARQRRHSRRQVHLAPGADRRRLLRRAATHRESQPGTRRARHGRGVGRAGDAHRGRRGRRRRQRDAASGAGRYARLHELGLDGPDAAWRLRRSERCRALRRGRLAEASPDGARRGPASRVRCEDRDHTRRSPACTRGNARGRDAPLHSLVTIGTGEVRAALCRTLRRCSGAH